MAPGPAGVAMAAMVSPCAPMCAPSCGKPAAATEARPVSCKIKICQYCGVKGDRRKQPKRFRFPDL